MEKPDFNNANKCIVLIAMSLTQGDLNLKYRWFSHNFAQESGVLTLLAAIIIYTTYFGV